MLRHQGWAFLSGVLCLVLGQIILLMYPSKLAQQSEGVREAARSMFATCGRQGKSGHHVGVDVRQAEAEDAPGDEDVKAEGRMVDEQWGDLKHRAAIAMRHMRKEFPGKGAAVDGVSLKVTKDECFGLLGPNGAGKTTLINILAGAITSTRSHPLDHINGAGKTTLVNILTGAITSTDVVCMRCP